MRELIGRFDIPLTFEEDALTRIFHYSGGQIYFIKLAVKLALSAYGSQAVGRLINGQIVDHLIHEVIEPTAKTPFMIRSINEDVFPTMSNIYIKFFSQEERQLMRLLTEANETLKASTLEGSRIQIANRLYQRGYISKNVGEEGEEYGLRISIWQIFLKNYLT